MSKQQKMLEGPGSKIKVADVPLEALGLWQQNPNSKRSFWESGQRTKAADSALL